MDVMQLEALCKLQNIFPDTSRLTIRKLIADTIKGSDLLDLQQLVIRCVNVLLATPAQEANQTPAKGLTDKAEVIVINEDDDAEIEMKELSKKEIDERPSMSVKEKRDLRNDESVNVNMTMSENYNNKSLDNDKMSFNGKGITMENVDKCQGKEAFWKGDTNRNDDKEWDWLNHIETTIEKTAYTLKETFTESSATTDSSSVDTPRMGSLKRSLIVGVDDLHATKFSRSENAQNFTSTAQAFNPFDSNYLRTPFPSFNNTDLWRTNASMSSKSSSSAAGSLPDKRTSSSATLSRHPDASTSGYMGASAESHQPRVTLPSIRDANRINVSTSYQSDREPTSLSNTWMGSSNESASLSNTWMGSLNESASLSNTWMGSSNESASLSNTWMGSSNKSASLSNTWMGSSNESASLSNTWMGSSNESASLSNTWMGSSNESASLSNTWMGSSNESAFQCYSRQVNRPYKPTTISRSDSEDFRKRKLQQQFGDGNSFNTGGQYHMHNPIQVDGVTQLHNNKMSLNLNGGTVVINEVDLDDQPPRLQDLYRHVNTDPHSQQAVVDPGFISHMKPEEVPIPAMAPTPTPTMLPTPAMISTPAMVQTPQRIQTPEMSPLRIPPEMVLSPPRIQTPEIVPTPAPTEQPQPTEEVVSIDVQMVEVMNLIPDIDVQFLRTKLQSFQGGSNELAVQRIVNYLLENNYPKQSKETNGASVQVDTDYFKDFSSFPSLTYTQQVRSVMLARHHKLSTKFLRSILGLFNYHYAPTEKAIQELIQQHKGLADSLQAQGKTMMVYEGVVTINVGKSSRSLHIKTLKCGRSNYKPPSLIIPELQDEMDFYVRHMQMELETVDRKLAVTLNGEEYEQEGQLIECGCCYGEVAFEEMVQCSDGHLFCSMCMSSYAREAVYGSGKLNLFCMTDGCETGFPKSQLDKCLPKEILDKYEERQKEESLNLADMDDLVKCPSCDFAAIMDPDDKVFKCQNPDCRKESCRYCKESWKEHFGVPCSEIEKKDETSLRVSYEERMTNAKMRTCFKCKTGYMKIDGCNKITCRCGAKMCYICRKPNINYGHFCQHVRNPGHGCTTCNDCSLWSDPKEDDERAVKEIQKQLQDERKAKGYNSGRESEVNGL